MLQRSGTDDLGRGRLDVESTFAYQVVKPAYG
jgi:hypothetical protein